MHAIASARSLSDVVADRLLQQLVSGGLAQGQRVDEAELSRALGISRNPNARTAHSLLTDAGESGTEVRWRRGSPPKLIVQ